MKRFRLLGLGVVALIPSACMTTTNLTPAQQAQLACMTTQLAADLAANHTNPVRAAVIQADGTILCTFVTGAAIVVTK